MAKILGSLPPKYSTLVTAWDSVPANEQSIGTLLERLIKEESKLTVEDEATSALAVESVNRRKNGRFKNARTKAEERERPSVECYYCKKKGHFARECRQKKKDTKSKQGHRSSENSAFVTTLNQERKKNLCR